MQGMQVGIVDLFPGAHQAKHIHYDEQVIYVTQGQAVSSIDGVERTLCVGDFLHWKSGVVHEVYNVGNTTFSHLLISNPHAGEMNETQEAEKVKGEETEADLISSDFIYIAAEAVRTQFLETLHYAYAIFDSMGNLVLQSRSFPEYCIECCQPMKNMGNCPCMHQFGPEEREKQKENRFWE